MGSLIIIPAAATKHLAANLNSMLAIAILSTFAGTSLAHALHRETWPVIIAPAAGVFFLSLVKRRGWRFRGALRLRQGAGAPVSRDCRTRPPRGTNFARHRLRFRRR